MPITVMYDTPIEVPKHKYDQLMKFYAGIVAGQKDKDKYYIKVFVMKYAKDIERIINSNK